MSKGKKSLVKVVYGRTLIVLAIVLIQLAVLFSIYVFLMEYVTYIVGASTVLSAIVLLYIINNRTNPMYKISWIIPVALMPIFGTLLYIFIHLQIETRLIAKKYDKSLEETRCYLEQDNDVLKELDSLDKHVASIGKYISNYGVYPVYKNTNVEYFPLGEDKFKKMIKELEKAKDFIFMEYFIIEEGVMWDTILDILKRKVKEGVEVRVMYDGLCCLALLPYKYPETLKKMGIKCKMFSPIKPALSTYQNNRDHRKILVIDGKVAFTGGVNLADEYINVKERFGHWKDIAVYLEGDAVKSFTMMFLQMWNITENKKEDYEKYILSKENVSVKSDGFVIPYGDSPLDFENLSEEVYFDIIHQATKYVHIMTPYLILDNEMITALTHAAKRGVEIIIIMPHIPDKPYAFWVAKTYYEELIEAGVQIYEYTPGFVHAKCFVSDNDKAVVGTINLDFRSLYLHFECGVFFYKNSVISKIEEDFKNTLEKCEKITLEKCKRKPLKQKAIGSVLRIFAPLM